MKGKTVTMVTAWAAAVAVLAAACVGPRPADPPLLTSRADESTTAMAGIDGEEAFAVVAELSGERYAGRIIGSDGGARARAYLADRLRGSGLDVSTAEFRERVALNVGEAVLETSTSGQAGPVAVFEYRVDFREVPRGGYDGGRAEGPAHLLSAQNASFPPGAILLVPGPLYDQAAMDGWAAAGAAGLIVEMPAGTPRQRPLWAGQQPGALVEVKTGMPVLGVSAEAFQRIEAGLRAADTAGATVIRMASPVRFTDVTGTNLLGAWNGDGGGFAPRIVVVAHYDHVGTDADGSRFPGALDNASGASLALAIATAWSRDRVRADVAVLFTDGEEAGLSGARAFVAAPPFPLAGATVLNLDMVGSRTDLAYSVYSSGGEASVSLSLEVERALRAAGFRARSEHPVPNLDHDPFARAGAAAVSVCEYDTARYHQKSDTAEFVDPAELDAVGDALYALLSGLTGD